MLLDVTLNVTIGSVGFLELPPVHKKEWLLTDRLQRHMVNDNWRGTVARWVCSHLLDPYQDGGHC